MKLKFFLKWSVIIIVTVIGVGLIFPTWTPNIKGENSISELKQLEINGVKQEIMIRGSDVNNPILIFVHGGPACPEIPYVTKYQELLEDDFTVVHYDQRGSGKSYHFFDDYSNLSSELLVDDLDELTDYILKRFDKEKIILVGHSYGTYIAMQAAEQAPEKYTAYIGIGQMSNITDSEVDSLNYCIEQAQKEEQLGDIEELEKLRGQIEAGSTFTPRKYINKYGGGSRLIDANNDYNLGFLLQREYNLLDIVRFKRGLTVSQEPLLGEVLEKNLPSFIDSLEIPFYFVMGQYDYMTSSQAAKEYFDKIDAPHKEFLLYQNSAHYPQFEEKEKFAQWLIENFK